MDIKQEGPSMGEEWRWVPGYRNLYSVSNLGRVRSKDRIVPCRGGKTRLHRGKILAAGASGLLGYLTVTLHKDGVGKTLLVHRLVAQAWIPNPKGLPLVLHSDDDPSNCRDDNLKWGTHQDNMDDMVLKGRGSVGETNGTAKLTAKKILRIRELSALGYLQKTLAEKYQVAQGNISSIINRKTWDHV